MATHLRQFRLQWHFSNYVHLELLFRCWILCWHVSYDDRQQRGNWEVSKYMKRNEKDIRKVRLSAIQGNWTDPFEPSEELASLWSGLNRGDVWSVARKHKRWARFNVYVMPDLWYISSDLFISTRILPTYARENYLKVEIHLHSYIILKPRPHVSGYFWIRKFFFADSKNFNVQT